MTTPVSLAPPTPHAPAPATLRLNPLAGPPIAALAIQSGKPAVIGRQVGCDFILSDPTVSRQHIQVLVRGGTWLVCDIGSKHGTYLNGVRLPPHDHAPLHEGDLLRIGPWTFHVGSTTRGGPRMLSTNDDMASSSSRVRRVPQHEMSIRVRERLDLLIDAAGEIATADTIDKLARAALDAIVGGTGFPRAAFIRRLHSGEFDARSQVEVVASRVASQAEPAAEFDSFSLTMLRAADDGKLVVLDGGFGAVPHGQSLIDLRIQYALCAPILLDGIPAAYLYLDSRVHEPAPGTVNTNAASSLNSDAPAFAQAVARLCGLAMANINRLALDRRRRELEDDLLAARAAQSLLMPKPHGGLGRFRYAVHSTPGRLVAGDLFDASLLPDGRLAVVIGDVMGKGVGAAILMSGAQAHLTATLRHFGEPAAAVNETNRYIQAHAQPGCFISLMAAILDPRSGSVSFVDAGHGHWMLKLPSVPPRPIRCVGGPPINVDPDAIYVNEFADFPVGASLLLYSDGLVEQRSPAGEMFGSDRVPDAVGDSDDPRHIVDALTARLREFSGDTARLDDDVTIAVISRDA